MPHVAAFVRAYMGVTKGIPAGSGWSNGSLFRASGLVFFLSSETAVDRSRIREGFINTLSTGT